MTLASQRSTSNRAEVQPDAQSNLRPVDDSRSMRTYLEALWGRRDFAVAMPAENLRSEHNETFLGNVWHLFNPALTVLVYFLVFGLILKANRGIDNYMLWLTIGVFAFGLTQASVLSGATSITSNMGLIRAIRFPRAVLPIAAVVGRLISFGFQLAVIGLVAVATGAGVSRRWLVLPIVVLIHTVLNLGGAFIAARLSDSFRDMQQIIPFGFRLAQFVSGVMYPVTGYLDGTHIWLQRLVMWNPIVTILAMYRWAFLGDPVAWSDVVRCVVVSSAILFFGFRYFVGAEHRYGRA